MNYTLAQLRIVEAADRAGYEAARRQYLNDPTEPHRLEVVKTGRRWADSQDALNAALEAERRLAVSDALGGF